ncbi:MULTISPECIES: hypothetical protein [unclassified Cryobacterium]|uniref:hypothetical protein n=1 Tax=unclassified Cryobacterium TaxID=2649013 RepID=UPI00106D774B|nr:MULTISPECIES: hypothetical protein [unclassified Cryobacterium]TFC59407.1 hypothetical protein E3O68_00465 [Cryobacterium sp. TMB3-1-2]TFC67203.1 hypothetical protein E3T21_17160 [Cryobacterium sp. TMB3-15]TFC73284.1 hypothetical protein E3T22_16895 [Cryobacterium sp. TMB3-10]TFD46172.1 hypothetical protein E3T58_01530 [Cryobacterium sp. TMB3-12]
MADNSLYETTQQTAGTLALAHEKLLRLKRNGNFENVTGDINNLAGVPSKIVVARENYGNKGRTSESKLGDNWVITFDVEAVRDDLGAIAQPWLVPLLNVGKATGAANKIDAQLFDAKDPALGAIEGTFTVEVVDFATGFADKGGYKVTLTSDGVVRQVTSPIAGSGAPIIASVLPLNQGAGSNIYVRGGNVSAITAAAVGGVVVPLVGGISQIPGEPNIVVLELPAGSAGSAPIVLTNANGASVAYPYVRIV